MTDAVTVYDDEGSELTPAKPNREAWSKIAQSKLGPRMKRALLRVAAGGSWRDAAKSEDYANHADVYRNGCRFGLLNLTTRAVINGQREIALLSNEELKRRLIKAPEEIKDRDLIVAGGVAADKVLAFEKADQHDGVAYIQGLERLAQKAMETGRGAEIVVAVRPTGNSVQDSPSCEPEVIDVTPESRPSCEIRSNENSVQEPT